MNAAMTFSVRSFGIKWAVVAACALGIFLSLVQSLRAQDSVTLEFPRQNNGAVLPVGFSDWPRETNQGLATVELPLLRLNEEGTLIATVVFQDEDGRVILAKWRTPEGKETVLSANISEGVSGWNQRILMVPYDLLSESGSLIFESDAEIQPIKRVNLAWTWRTEVFMGTGAQDVEVVQDERRVLTKKDLADQVIGSIPDAWAKGIWKAFLQEDKEPLDGALGFSFAMEGLPKAAVLRGKLLGFPLNATPDIWVNDQKVEGVSVNVPALGSEGFFKSPSGQLSYAGWREVSVSIPAAYFKTGENSIIFDGRKGVYLKETFLELNFETEGAPFTVPDESALPAVSTSQPATAASIYPDPEPWGPSPSAARSEPHQVGPAVIVVPVENSEANL